MLVTTIVTIFALVKRLRITLKNRRQRVSTKVKKIMISVVLAAVVLAASVAKAVSIIIRWLPNLKHDLEI